jgi:hypothetical protein
MPALALAVANSGQSLRYIGLERDPGSGEELLRFLKKYDLRGEVMPLSIFDLDFRSSLPEGILVFCFEHSLEDVVLAELAESQGIYDLCWPNVIASIEARFFEGNASDFARAVLSRAFLSIESVSLERPQNICLVHHFGSPQYEGSRLQRLDTEVRERSWGTLTARYETLLSIQPESELPNEFWWLGHMIPKKELE